ALDLRQRTLKGGVARLRGLLLLGHGHGEAPPVWDEQPKLRVGSDGTAVRIGCGTRRANRVAAACTPAGLFVQPRRPGLIRRWRRDDRSASDRTAHADSRAHRPPPPPPRARRPGAPRSAGARGGTERG